MVGREHLCLNNNKKYCGDILAGMTVSKDYNIFDKGMYNKNMYIMWISDEDTKKVETIF